MAILVEGKDSIFWVLSCIRIVVFSLMTLLFCPYCLWIFYKDRHESYAQKRRPWLVYFLVVINIIISWYWTFFEADTCIFKFCENASYQTHRVFVFLTVAPMTLCLTSRVWFLYYDLKYGEALILHSWWQTITNQKNWFIAHRNSYGLFRGFMVKRIILFGLIWMISLYFTTFYCVKNVSLMIFLIVINIWWLFMIFLFYKMPKQYDALLIRKEINRLTLFYAFSTIWYSISTQKLNYIEIHWFNAFYTDLFTVIIIAMTTLWPHFDRSLQEKRNDRKKMSFIQQKNNDDNKIGTWLIYVNQCNDNKNWNKFMRFLVKEISVENLCFILESIQFKQELISNYNDIFKNNQFTATCNEENGFIVKIPNGLPKSSIINNNKNDYKVQIEELYKKYIAFDAILAINISYETRIKFMNDKNDINKSDDELNLVNIESNITTNTKNDHVQLGDVPNLKIQCEQNSEYPLSINDEMQQKILKIFDNALYDINKNLYGSFYRFKLNENIENNQNIVAAMMKTAKM